MEKKNMHSTKTAFLIGLSLMATACGTGNRGLESVHQPVVSRTDYILDVGSTGDGLVAGDVGRLTGWFDSLRLGYGDKISVDGSSSARDAVSNVAAHYGLIVDAIAPTTSGAIAPGDARVVVSRLKAEVPNCPDWSSPSESSFNNNTNSNFGCAINSSLAAMVANPEDLVLGRVGTGVGNARTSAKAIKSYRDTKPTGENGLERITTGAGK
jgi:pilus assembly protein CpaD